MTLDGIMETNMLYRHYGIHCDYAARREFHRAFWDALAAFGSRTFARLGALFNAQRLQREVC